MKSKIFLASAFITAVILVVIGAVTSTAMANQAAAQAANQDPIPQEEIQAYQEREAAYNQVIEQANQQLEQANREIQALQEQINQVQAPLAIEQPAGITAEQAGEIAGKSVDIGQKPLKAPELVAFENKPAYEIVYEAGSVYIDAQTGEVLFNGTIPQEITLEQAALIAGDYIRNHAVYQVDEVPFRGEQIIRVIFKDGTFVFLDKTGQITYIQAPGPRADAAQISLDSGGGGGGDDRYEDDDDSYEHEDEHEEEHESEHEDD